MINKTLTSDNKRLIRNLTIISFMFHISLFIQGANRPFEINALTDTRKTRFFQIEDLLYKKIFISLKSQLNFLLNGVKIFW